MFFWEMSHHYYYDGIRAFSFWGRLFIYLAMRFFFFYIVDYVYDENVTGFKFFFSSYLGDHLKTPI